MLNIRKRFFLLLTIVGLVVSLASCTKKNNYIEVTFDADEKVIVVGETIDLKPIVNKGEQAGEVTLVYVSRDEKVATYSDAKVTGIAVGQTVVKAYCKEKEIAYDTVVITVIKDRLPIMDFGTVPGSMLKTAEYQLRCTFTPATSEKDVAFAFSSSNPEVATVDKKGLITAKQVGKVTITVVATNLLYENETRTMRFEIEVLESDFAINYELNGGQNAESNPAGYDVFNLPIALAEATKVGYTFAGWYDNAEFEGDAVEEIAANSRGDITLYAKWDIVTYNVTYDLAGGEGATNNPATYTVENDLPIALEEPTRKGYKFLGWYEGETKVEELTVETLKDYALVAKWEIIEYSISYDLNGGEWPFDANDLYFYSKDREAMVDDFLNDAMAWGNKTEKPNCMVDDSGEKSGFATIFSAIKGFFTDEKYAAKWAWLNEYLQETKVEGKNLESEAEYRYAIGAFLFKEHRTSWPYSTDYTNEELANGFWEKLIDPEFKGLVTSYNVNTETFTLTQPELYGYKFLGWFDENGIEYEEVEQGSTGNLKLAAQWELGKYQITYTLNGGKFAGTYADIDEFAKEFVADFNKYAGVTSVTIAEFHTTSSGPVKKAMANAEMLAKYEWLFKYIKAEMEANVAEDKKTDAEYTETMTLLDAMIAKDTNAIGVSANARTTFRHFIHNLINKNHKTGTSDGKDYYLPYTVDFSVAENQARFMAATPKPEGLINEFSYTDEVIKLSVPEKANNEFVGWFLDGEKVESIDPKLAQNVELVAKWANDPIEIDYQLAGGTLAEDAALTFTYADGLETLPVPTKPGYKFIDWFSDAECTEKVASIEAGLLESVTLYASWEIVVYNITYELNGGAFLVDKVVDVYDTFNDMVNEFVADYATVTGVTGVTKENFYGKSAKYGLYAFFKNEDMATKWNWLLEYVQAYANELGYIGKAYLNISAGAANFNKYARPNFAALLQETMLTNVSPISMNFKEVDSEAFWAACPDKTISVGTDSVKTYTVEELPLKLSNPNKDGATFVDWYTNEDLKNGKVTEIAAGTTGDIKLYARWSDSVVARDTFTITYELNGGTLEEGAPATYLEGTGVTLDKGATKAGYAFKGWFLDAECTEEVKAIGADALGNKTLYAAWEAVTYTVTYNVGEGEWDLEPEDFYRYGKDREAMVDDFLNDAMAWGNKTEKPNCMVDDSGEKSGFATIFSAIKGLFTDEKYAAKWAWLNEYLQETKVEGKTLESEAEYRYAIGAFLFKEHRTSWPYSTDYTNEELANGFWEKLYSEKITSTYTIEQLPLELLTPLAPEGMQFAGWYNNAEFTGEGMFELPVGTTGNLELWAKYDYQDCDITYELNGGENHKDNPAKYNGSKEIILQAPYREGYDFVGWELNGEAVEKLEIGKPVAITLVAVWKETAVYTIDYVLDGGAFAGIYADIDEFAATFLADFNKYGNCNVTIADFHGSTGSAIKTAFANAEMLAKYKWLFEYIKVELAANAEANGLTSEAAATEGAELLGKLIAGDTAAINGSYANGRTVIRHFIHNLMNKDHESAGTTNGAYLKYTNDYSDAANVAEFMAVTPRAKAPASEYTRFDTITLLTPAKEGYKFLGWYNGDVKVELIEKGTTGNLTLTAKWTLLYTITYEVAEGVLNNPVELYTVLDEVVLPVPTKENYIFRGWYNNAELTGEAVNSIAKGSEGNKTFYAKWDELVDYTISYDLNGGEIIGGYTNIDEFAATFLADFNKYGKCNVTIANFHGSTGSAIKTAFANAEMLAKYKWLFEYIKVELAANAEANGLTSEAPATQGAELLGKLIAGDTAAINGLYADGRTVIRHFIHNLMNKDHESAGTTNGAYLKYTNDYSDAANVAEFMELALANVDKPVETYTELDAFTLPVLSKEGYVFVGWLNDNEVITEIEAGTTGNLALVAQFELIKYSLTLNANGGNIINGYANIDEFAKDFVADFNKYGDGSVTTIENFHVSSHPSIKTAFANAEMLAKYKWLFEYILVEMTANIEANDLGATEAATEGLELLNKLIAGDTAAINGSYSNGRSVVRHFIHNLINKDHNSAGTTEGAYLKYTNDYSDAANVAEFMAAVKAAFPVVDKFTEEDTVVLPEAYKEGFKFLGWFDGEAKVDSIPAGTKKDVTLVAKWEGQTYTITYDPNNGTLEGEYPNEYVAGIGLETLPVPVKEGVNFLGWFDEDGNLVESISANSIGNIKLKAKWSQGAFDAEYDIVYDLQGGQFTNGYATVVELGAAFLADFNAYASSPATASNFLKDSTSTIKEALSNPDMLSKWNWFFAYMLEDLTQFNKGTTDEWVTTALPLLKLIVDGDTSAISDSGTGGPNVRTLVRSYLHGVMNESQGDMVNNSSFASLTPDFSKEENQKALLLNQYQLELTVVGGSALNVPSKHAYKFLGWKNADGDITEVANCNGTYVAQWEEITPVTKVEITNKVTGLDVLTTYQLQWTITPAEALLVDVKFTSSDEEIATVDKNGLITTHKNGTVTITIISLSKDGHTDSVTINVTTPGHFEISYETNSYVEVDDTIKLNAIYENVDGSLAQITWESADETIATVDENGVVTAHKEGVVVIKAINGEKEFEFVVTVVNSEISAQLQLVLDSHNSNTFIKYNLNVGPVKEDGSFYDGGYYADIYGSVSKLLYNDPLNIDRKYEAAMLEKYGDAYEARKMESIEFITVHYTAGFPTTSDANANMSWFTAPLSKNTTSIHYTTGNDGVFSGVGEAYKAAHAGDDGAVAFGVPKFEWRPTTIKIEATDPLFPVVTITANATFAINGKDTGIKVPEETKFGRGYVADNKWLNDMGIAVDTTGEYYQLGTAWWCYTQVTEGRICSNGGNANSIGIESVVNNGSDLWWTWQRTAQLVADIMDRNDLDITRVKGHHFFSAKNCPQPMLENDLEIWGEFIELVQAERKAIDVFENCTVEFTSNSQTVNDKGRIAKLDNDSQIVTYTVTITNGDKVETITLASAIQGHYSK